MRSTDSVIAEAFALGGGALRVADLPEQRRSLQRRTKVGELVQIWPGVVIRAEDRHDLMVLASAACRWQPDAVLTGATAARFTFWAEAPLRAVAFSSPVSVRTVPAPYVLQRERLPAELVVRGSGVNVTAPALTALDLVATVGGAGIDEALRRGACRLPDMSRALDLTPRRAGNPLRRMLLHDSRDEPWSEAERLLHRILRGAGVTGWVTNHPVHCAGQDYRVDLAFVAERVAVEVDGFAFHSTKAQFHHDRRRWTNLQADGWLIVHLTWDQLTNDPTWVLASIAAVRGVSRWQRRRSA